MRHKPLGKLGALAIAGCVIFGAGLRHALAQTKVEVRTDYRFNGYVAPIALAIDRGFYKDAGLDVSVEQGQGSATTVQTVASGVDTFGLADSATAVLGITAQNVPVKIVSVYNQTGTMGLIYHPESNWDGDLGTLKDKVVISSAGTADAKLLEPVLASAHMKLSDVELQLVAVNARVPLFLENRAAYLTGFETGDYLRVRSRLPNAKYMSYAKYGIVAYGIGLIAQNDMIEKNPDLVKKFVRSTQKGWEAAAKDPNAAVTASLKLYPDLSAELLRDGLKISLEEQLHTPATKGQPIGWTAESDWKGMIQVLKTYSGLKPKPISTYYTNKFTSE